MMSPEDSSNHSASLSSSHNNNPDEENKDAHNNNMAKEESFAATASAVLATTATTTTVDDTAVDNQLPEEAKEAKTTMMADTAMAMQEDTAATVADTTRMATRNKNSNNNNNTEETASSVQQQQQEEDLTETSSSAAMEDISLTGHSIRDNDPKDKEEEEEVIQVLAAAEETKDTLVPLAATTTTTRTAAAHRAAPDIVPLEKDDDDDVNNEETTTTPNPPELVEGCESMTSASSIITPSASAASFEAPNSNNNSSNNNEQQQQQQHHLPPGIQFEQCLYGFSNVIAQAEAAAEANQNEEQDNDDDHHHHRHFVLDDWDYIREPYLWKSQQHHTISMSHLRKMASQQGIPDEGSHRAVTWRVLLGYLPPDNSQWDSTLQQKRSLYKSFVKDLFHHVPDCLTNGDDLRWKRKVPNRGKQPVAAGFAAAAGGGGGGGMVTDGSESSTEDHHTTTTATTTASGNASPEHPSSPSSGKQQQQQQALDSDSDRSQSTAPHDFGTEHAISPIPSPIKAKWKEKSGLDLHILDNLMKNMNALQLKDLHEIDDDTVVSDARFYDFADSARLIDEIRKDVIRTFPDLAFFLDPDENLGKRRYAALERILFVWAKYNKGVKYVQGMNEIVGTVYYVLANDWNAEWAAEAEADTYWLFHTLMTDMQDVFVPDLDDADTGIQGRIEMMESLLRRHDPEVKEHLEDVGVECSFFAIRWWTTLLSREFLLPDTIRLWDSMFASTHKDNFLCYLCVTMVIMIREDLLKGDFSRCLRLLQGYPPVMMDRLLESSRSLWVYERQITMACHKGGISLHQALQAVPPPDSIIMAFGFRNGVMPKTRAERLEEVGERAATSVREATSVVKASAKGWLGRASRFYNKYSQEYSNRARSRSSDSIRSERGSEPDSLVAESLPDDMDVYMDAISNAETGKWNYGSPPTRKD